MTASAADQAPSPAAIEAVILERSEKLRRPMDPASSRQLAAAVSMAGTEHDLEPAVLLAIIETESGYSVVARSEKNCQGLMQVAPATARAVAARIGIRIKTLASIETNVQIGAAYLKEMWNKYRRLDHALAAYNLGPGNFETLGRPLGSYVAAVMRRKTVLQALFIKNKTGLEPPKKSRPVTTEVVQCRLAERVSFGEDVGRRVAAQLLDDVATEAGVPHQHHAAQRGQIDTAVGTHRVVATKPEPQVDVNIPGKAGVRDGLDVVGHGVVSQGYDLVTRRHLDVGMAQRQAQSSCGADVFVAGR